MKQIIALALAALLLVGLCACAAEQPATGAPSERETASAPSESRADAQRDPEPTETQEQTVPSERRTEPQKESQTEPQTEPAPTETRTEQQPEDGPETKRVSLKLPFMETEDYVSFWAEDGAQSAGLSLEIPADWTEDAGLFYCPMDGGVRKVLEPICLLRTMDDAQWEELAQFDLAESRGETEYLSVSRGVDANGRAYIQLWSRSWPEGGAIRVWYPCTCFLRDPGGSAAVLIWYLLDPEDSSARAELLELLDSVRLE